MDRPWRAIAFILVLILLAGSGPCHRTNPGVSPPVTPDPDKPIVPAPPTK